MRPFNEVLVVRQSWWTPSDAPNALSGIRKRTNLPSSRYRTNLILPVLLSERSRLIFRLFHDPKMFDDGAAGVEIAVHTVLRACFLVPVKLAVRNAVRDALHEAKFRHTVDSWTKVRLH